MNKKLFFQSISKFFIGLFAIMLLLFAPAGTIKFWNGWLLICILFVPMLIAGIVMMIYNPKLLQKRLNVKEKDDTQKSIVALSGLMFITAFIFAGLNFRFNWLSFPFWAVVIAAIVFLLAYLMYAEVLRENTYLSRTIEIQENQRVTYTGLYGIIRHPMYCATVFLFLSMGIVLDSPVSFAVLLLYIPIIAKRIKNEEKILEKGLDGYIEYKKRIKYRLIPFVW